MGDRTPLHGFNHNILHAGRRFHVQTEDSLGAHPHVSTHVFLEGAILGSRRSGYAREEDAGVVLRLMQEQHKGMLKDLRRGAFDEKIAACAGQAAPAVELPADPSYELTISGGSGPHATATALANPGDAHTTAVDAAPPLLTETPPPGPSTTQVETPDWLRDTDPHIDLEAMGVRPSQTATHAVGFAKRPAPSPVLQRPVARRGIVAEPEGWRKQPRQASRTPAPASAPPRPRNTASAEGVVWTCPTLIVTRRPIPAQFVAAQHNPTPGALNAFGEPTETATGLDGALRALVDQGRG